MERGDADNDDTFSPLVEAIFILYFAFLDGPEPPWLDAADADDSGKVQGLVDSLYVPGYGFTGGPAPPWPGPNVCGVDYSSDRIDCNAIAEACR